MRLTGGRLKGRKIRAKGLGRPSRHGVLRATSSKTREAIFNIIGNGIEGAVFVDLYAGTGAVGMEALSRGALEVCFVEPEGRRAEALEGLLRDCGCTGRAGVARMRAADFTEKAARASGGKWDIVFLDPPYRSEELELLLPLLGAGTVLAEGAFVIAEHMKDRVLPDEVGLLRKKKVYRYGDTVLTLYGKEA